ncbi:MAG: cytochrome b [Betaproteobacteria bacterium]|nr:cytochrome b [Betaproteobacteria bacterium]MBI2960241.1 cytochrome b [Betaproteobacteria bacterium]
MFRNTRDAWGAPAKLFHWLMAALVFAQIPLGWTAATWPLSPLKLNLFVWHKSVGMLILALALLRLAWRLGNPAPALPADTLAWERLAARASHALLYLLMVALPVTGWVINSAANIPFRIFWLVPLPAIVEPSKHAAELAAAVHFGLFVFLATLLLVHIGAALRHHYIKRNDVLTRMLPGGGART